ncbi:Csu type fimbrial protein [Rouxiella sp. Mn2063]|uniref:Csu type fimbrial protein n=1 Tax=Rouxiella sp. Mn2063 TaxID=3395262 RepID=UPI003BCDC8F2
MIDDKSLLSYRSLLRWCTTLLLLFAGINNALAACTSTSGAGNLGTVTSFNVATVPQKVTATSGFACTGGLLTLLSTNTVTATIASTTNANGTTAELFNAANNQTIPYLICKDSACGESVNVGSSTVWSSTTLLGLLGLFTSNGTLPLYLQTIPGANVKAGVYTDTININWAWHLCALGVLGLCVYDDGTSSTFINVTMIVSNYCFIDNAPDVQFGTAAFPSGFAPVTGNSLSVRCTLGATYSINLTSNNPITGQYRQMLSTVNGTTNSLQYQILKADTTVWTPTANYPSIGTGLSQNINYTATVNPNQPNVPSGTYSDTVVVTVTY